MAIKKLQNTGSPLNKDVFLSLGSNQGDSVALLSMAREKLSAYVTIVAASEEQWTKPWGKTDQLDFLNQVVKVETALSAHELLDVIHTIEDELGRVRGEKWGPRTIDIDILLFGDLVIDDERLTIPHAYLPDRGFLQNLIEQINN